MSFFTELKRRNVIRVATGYALAAWIFIEAGSVLLPTFGGSEALFRNYVLLVVAGFIVAVIVAWVYEITPEGIRRETELSGSGSPAPAVHKSNLGLIVLLAIALLVSIGFNVSGIRQKNADSVNRAQLNAIAVLPFENRSTDPANKYFADGLHDDLLSRLAAIGELRVISITSVNAYRGTSKSPGEIGEELDVDAVIDGAVQRDGDQLRVSIQLFETADDTMLWSGSFDADAGMQSVFELQSEISRNISTELRASLSPDAAARMALVPTRNPAAYKLFVEAANNLAMHDYDALLLAREQFAQAIALDPGYARAHTGLAETVMDLLVSHRALPADEAYRIAERSVNLAIDADPGLADAYAVRGMIASRKWQRPGAGDDSKRAEADFRKALSLNPNLSSAYVWYAQLKEQQDEFDEAIDLLLRGLSVDPRNRIAYLELPALQALKGDNQRAIDLILAAMKLFPDWPAPYDLLARHLQKLGRLDEAVAWAFRLRELSNDPIAGLITLATLRTYDREDLIAKLLLQTPEDHPLHPIAIGFLQYIGGDFAASIETLDKIPSGALERIAVIDLFMARAAIRLGNHEMARHYLLTAAPELAKNPSDQVNRNNADEAVLLAYLADEVWEKDQRDKLLAAALHTTQALPATGLRGYGIRDVQIYELQGHRQKALDALQSAIDSGFVTEFPFDFWQIDENPILDSLRADPRYAALQSQMLQRLETMRETLEKAQASGNWQAVRDLTIAQSNSPASPNP